MKRIIITVTFLISSMLSFGQLPCSGFDGSEHDFAMDYWKKDYCDVMSSSSPYVTAGPHLNPLDGTPYAYVYDQMNSSNYYNDVKYNSLGQYYLGDCLCFDYAVFDDSDPGSTHLIHPRVYLTWAGKTIYFESNLTVDEINKNWVRVCAPIQRYESYMVNLPANAEGQWHVGSGTMMSDFNDVLNFCTKLYFDIDFAGSSLQDEKLGIDNVCVKACNCESTITDYSFDIIYNTDPLASILPNSLTISPNSFNPTYTYEYSWGDGTFTTGSLPTASHIYSSAGTYTFKLSRLNSYGEPACNSTSTVFCMPVSSQYQTQTGGYTPPVNPVCNVGFILRYHYNTDPTFMSIIPNHYAQVAINSPHPGSVYSYNWGVGPIITTPATIQSNIYFAPPPYIQICVAEQNGNDDGFCTAKTCVDFCRPVSYAATEFGKKTQETKLLSETIDNSIKIYPNPAAEKAVIEFGVETDQDVSVSIFDLTGRKISSLPEQNYKSGNHKIDLNLSDLPSGLYQVKMMIGNKVTTQKLSVVK